jgi:hypothetical protein
MPVRGIASKRFEAVFGAVLAQPLARRTGIDVDRFAELVA